MEVTFEKLRDSFKECKKFFQKYITSGKLIETYFVRTKIVFMKKYIFSKYIIVMVKNADNTVCEKGCSPEKLFSKLLYKRKIGIYNELLPQREITCRSVYVDVIMSGNRLEFSYS